MSIQSILGDYILGLQHIGHVVPDLEIALESFKRVYGIPDDAIRRVPSNGDEAPGSLCAIVSSADTEFELIQPVSEQFRRLLSDAPSGGAGINHVAWRVSDIDACLAVLRERGIGPGYVTPEGVLSYGKTRMVYLDPAQCDGLYIELIEITD